MPSKNLIVLDFCSIQFFCSRLFRRRCKSVTLKTHRYCCRNCCRSKVNLYRCKFRCAEFPCEKPYKNKKRLVKLQLDAEGGERWTRCDERTRGQELAVQLKKKNKKKQQQQQNRKSGMWSACKRKRWWIII